MYCLMGRVCEFIFFWMLVAALAAAFACMRVHGGEPASAPMQGQHARPDKLAVPRRNPSAMRASLATYSPCQGRWVLPIPAREQGARCLRDKPR